MSNRFNRAVFDDVTSRNTITLQSGSPKAQRLVTLPLGLKLH
jgi:hypothetical protein